MVAYTNLPFFKEKSLQDKFEYDSDEAEYDDTVDIKYNIQVSLTHDSDSDENSYFNSDRYKMYQELSTLRNQYDDTFKKHVELEEIIGQAYSVAINYTGLDSKEMLLCVEKCNEDFKLIPDIIQYYRNRKNIYSKYGIQQSDYTACPYSIKKMLIIMEKMGKYDDALDLCQWALDNGLTHDRTEGGIVGRMARIAKKKNKTK